MAQTKAQLIDGKSATIEFSGGSSSAPAFTFTGDTNTGIYSPGADQVAISTNGSGRLFVDSSGSVGIGTSSPGYKLNVNGSGYVFGLDGGGTSRIAQAIRNTGGQLSFGLESSVGGQLFTGGSAYSVCIGSDNATSLHLGTNGTVRATIDSSGRVGIGTTSPSTLLHLRGSLPELRIDGDSTSGVGGLKIYSSATELASFTYSNVSGENRIGGIQSYVFPTFYSGGSERARIDTSGRLLVGTSTARTNFFNGSAIAPFLQIEGTGSTRMLSVFSNNTDGGVLVLGRQGGSTPGGNTLVANNDEIGIISFQASDGTDPTECARIQALIDGAPGNNDTPGRLVFSTTADGASSPTERMRITNFGLVNIGSSYVINPGIDNTDNGINLNSGYGAFSRDSLVPLFLNRNTNDGTLVSLRQAGIEEGSISVSGTTVSYNGAHLSRWSQIPGIDPHEKDQRFEILRGTVMSNLDEMCDWIDPKSGDAQENEQLNKTKISDAEGDKNVAGVFQSWDDDGDTWVNDYYLAMTGDFIIRIGAGVTVERGDLLMSAGDGTAKPQDDDIIRSKTIAKVTSTTVSCTYDDGSYCVPCVLMAC